MVLSIRPVAWLFLLAMAIQLFAMPAAIAQGTIRADQKYIEAIKKSSGIAPVGVDSFGDNLDISSGSVEFKWTDIDIPGNNALPVRLQRSLVVEDKFLAGGSDLGGFDAAGSIDIPYLKGVFPTTGWQVSGSSPDARCSMFNSPPAAGGGGITASDYWNGNWLHIPWDGDQIMLSNPASVLPKPTGGATIMTKNFWSFQCSSSTQNGYPGESFIALSPQGDKYYFNRALTKPYPSFSKRYGNYPSATASIDRVLVYFLVTRIEDRFGNWVTYEYNGDKLSRISSSDNRYIQINSWSGDKVTSVSSSVGTWTYSYTANSMTTTQPDGSHWRYVTSGELLVDPTPALPVYDGAGIEGQPPLCPVPEPSSGDYTMAVTQPSGATATYAFTVLRQFKNNVPKLCNSFIELPRQSYRYLTIPNFNDALRLVSKTISGLGLSAMQWTYSYAGGGPLAFEEVCSNPQTPLACSPVRTTVVRGPGRRYELYTFGNLYKINSGQLLRVDEGYETGAAPNVQAVILKSTVNTYMSASEVSGQTFPDRVGLPGSSRFDDAQMASLRPLKTTEITQDGAGFLQTNLNFDAFARPTKVTKSSSMP